MIVRPGWVCAALLVGVLAWPVSAWSQDPASLYGQVVVAVRFDIEGRIDTSPELLALSDVRIGAPLRQQDMRSSLSRLDAIGRFENVIPVGTAVPGGVEVLFRLVPRHPINRLAVRGDTGIPAETLRQQVLQRYGGVPSTDRPAAVASSAIQLLRDAGYLDATVEPEVELTHDPEGATLILNARAGAIATIVGTAVDLRGVRVLGASEVIERTRTEKGMPFRRRDIESSLTDLEDYYRQRGYYVVQALMQTERTPEGVLLRIVVDTGPRVEVVVRPDGVLSGSAIDDLIPIERLGSADQDLLEDSRARIETQLKHEGYLRASAPFTPVASDDQARLVITFDVNRGPRFFVDRVEMSSNLSLPESTIRRLISVKSGDVFDESRFTADLELVKAEYRSGGYYAAVIEPAYQQVDERSGAEQVWVVLRPTITEGPRGTVTDISFRFAGPHEIAESELRPVLRSVRGEPYIEMNAALDWAGLRQFYRDRGFRSAEVSVTPDVSNEGRDIALAITVSEGPRVRIGEIQVSGNSRVSTREILDTLDLSPGDPAGDTLLNAAKRRLDELGQFRRTTFRLEEPITAGGRALLLVNVIEAPNTSFGWGGGLEGRRNVRNAEDGGVEDYLEWSPRGFIEADRRNLGGRNRSLSFFSRVSFNPRRVRGDESNSDDGITEYRVTGTYRDRRLFGSSIDLLVGVTSEQAFRTSFDFVRNSANLEGLHRLSERVSLVGRYSLEFTRLLNERFTDADDQPLIDRLYPQVRLSLVGLSISWDQRNDPLSPTAGTLVTADGELSSRLLGSEVGYVKTYFQASAFRSLDHVQRTVLAIRGQIGMANGFRRTVQALDPEGSPLYDEHGRPVLTVVQDLPASQRFYAGGGTTVRGFQLDRLGVEEIINPNGLSLGGNGLVVANAELRRGVCRCRSFLGTNLSAVGFVDSGNVFAKASDIELGRLRGTAGMGMRYNSLLGPLRLDFGFKMSTHVVGGRPERGWEYHLSIGEAF